LVFDGKAGGGTVNLGDHLTGPLDPAGTADLLIERGMLSVCGNDDRVLLEEVEQFSDGTTGPETRKEGSRSALFFFIPTLRESAGTYPQPPVPVSFFD
jgi:hypothetical protein